MQWCNNLLHVLHLEECETLRGEPSRAAMNLRPTASSSSTVSHTVYVQCRCIAHARWILFTRTILDLNRLVTPGPYLSCRNWILWTPVKNQTWLHLVYLWAPPNILRRRNLLSTSQSDGCWTRASLNQGYSVWADKRERPFSCGNRWASTGCLDISG